MSIGSRLATLERRQQAAQLEEQTAPGAWYEDEAFLAGLPPALLDYLCDPTAEAGWCDALAGNHWRHEPVSLRSEQRRLLMEAEYRLYDRATADKEQAHNLLYDTPRPLAAWDDFSGETWVAFWRAHGTTDPATLATAGLGEAELALLEAEEEQG